MLELRETLIALVLWLGSTLGAALLFGNSYIVTFVGIGGWLTLAFIFAGYYKFKFR